MGEGEQAPCTCALFVPDPRCEVHAHLVPQVLAYLREVAERNGYEPARRAPPHGVFVGREVRRG